MLYYLHFNVQFAQNTACPAEISHPECRDGGGGGDPPNMGLCTLDVFAVF
jgi:hypothetical protein